MGFVATVGIGFAGALLCCVFAPAQHNPEPPDSGTTSKQSSIDQDAFDKRLKRILRESTTLFRFIEGVRFENRRRECYHEPKINLPTASYCRILKHEGTTIYTCEWENRKTVNDWYPRLVASIERSLGPEWNKRPGPWQTGQQTVFARDGKATVQVIREQKAAVVHVVILPDGASQEGIRTDLPLLPDFFHPKSPAPVCSVTPTSVHLLSARYEQAQELQKPSADRVIERNFLTAKLARTGLQ